MRCMLLPRSLPRVAARYRHCTVAWVTEARSRWLCHSKMTRAKFEEAEMKFRTNVTMKLEH